MIRTTIIGGIFFLIPFAFLMIVLTKAHEIGLMVAKPIERLMPIERVVGIALADVLAMILVLALCFLAGLLARVGMFHRRVERVDGILIELIPGYAVAKSSLHGVTGKSGTQDHLVPVLVEFDDHKMIAFEVERTSLGVMVFLPGAPSPWAGSTALIEPERIQPLDLSVTQVTRLLRVLGRGSAATFADGAQNA